MENIYKSLDLKKIRYMDSKKSFSDILEDLDPSYNYKGTHLEYLDAFQRQLKRLNIHVNGENADTVAKFFGVEDAKFLFPEYISRSVNSGIEEETILKDLIANTIKIDGLSYKGIIIDPSSNSEIKEIKDGDQIPEVKLSLKENSAILKKIGSMITFSYEVLFGQKIPAFSLALKQIGKNFNNFILKDAINTIIKGDGNDNEIPELKVAKKLSYQHLLEMWTKLKPYNLNTIISSPKTLQKILTINEISSPQTGMNFQQTGVLTTTLGAKIICTSAIEDNILLGMDKNFTLDFITSQDLKIEDDKIVDKQQKKIVITKRYAFVKLFKDAAVLAKISNE